MTMRQTPFLHLRYPWTSDVVNAADVQAMGADIDQALVQTASLSTDFVRMASVVARRAAAQSVAKATLSTIVFDSVVLNNGANSPLSDGSWYNVANPTRLTAPVPCVVLASGFGGFNNGAAWGTPATVQVWVTINGGVAAPNVQGTKYSPISTQSGQVRTSALTMWRLNAGDFLELKMHWNGTAAGPINTDTALPPSLALMMVALPSVP